MKFLNTTMRQWVAFKRKLLTVSQFGALLLAMFGGFYSRIAPPDDNLRFWPAYASLLAGLVFLAYQRFGKRTRRTTMWVAIALAAGFHLFYFEKYQDLAANYASSVAICGTRYTTRAAEYVARHQNVSKEDLLLAFGGKVKDIWTENSIHRAHLILGLSYSGAVGFLALALLAGLEESKERQNLPNALEGAPVAGRAEDSRVVDKCEGHDLGTRYQQAATIERDLCAQSLGQQRELTMSVDPTAAMSAIAAGLGLVDKFVDLVHRLRQHGNPSHRVEAKEEDDALVIKRGGDVVERVQASQLRLNEWDAPRFEALRIRAISLWNQYNGLYAQLPNLSVDEQVRLQQRMDQMRRDLCRDFREMMSISERVLGVGLDDHYSLSQTCSDLNV